MGSVIDVIQCYGDHNVALWSGSVGSHYLTTSKNKDTHVDISTINSNVLNLKVELQCME